MPSSFLFFSNLSNILLLNLKSRGLFLLFCVCSVFAAESASFQQNNTKNTAAHWSNQIENFAKTGEVDKQLSALLQLAIIYQKQRRNSALISVLKNANTLMDKATDPRQKISVLNSLGAAYTISGEYDKATKLLRESEKKARNLGTTRLLAAILNNQGNLQTQKKQYNQAIQIYEESIFLAQMSGNLMLTKKALINLAIAASKTTNTDKIELALLTAKNHLEKTNGNLDITFDWMSLGKIAQKLSLTHSDPSQWLTYAHYAFKKAVILGERMSNARAISYAKGYMGRLYLDRGRYAEALQLTHQAIFVLENINAAEILFRWQWQTGRILKEKGDNQAAISAYQQAISTLQPIRQNLLSQHYSSFSINDETSSLYLELADLLLLSSDDLTDPKEIQQSLILARNTMEQLKVAELRDYFKDDCGSVLEQKRRSLDNIGKQTAALYPILLAERLEILLSLPDGLKRFTIPVGGTEVNKVVRQFRHNLENRTTREYLLQAQQLYGWIIAPLLNALNQQKINTLIIVPDKALRTIPMAALHDGEEFLIEKYAVGNTPGLNLTDPKPLQKKNIRLLSTGLSKSVQGFSPLPHVASELQSIQKIFGGELLQDKEFLLKNVENQLQKNSFDIVHIASHGQFNNDVNENFVLTFDDKLSINKLEKLIAQRKFRSNPIELLTLSACQTAAGDDGAALGLAGIALKAGARSALATLWFINDKAASNLIVEFYRQLKQSSLSKAQALKNAQTSLIQSMDYQHPYFWSPFLLIGNWL